MWKPFTKVVYKTIEVPVPTTDSDIFLHSLSGRPVWELERIVQISSYILENTKAREAGA